MRSHAVQAADAVKSAFHRKSSDTEYYDGVDIIPPDTYLSDESIAEKLLLRIKELFALINDEIRQTVSSAKAKRAFNKAAGKAARERKASEKAVSGNVKKNQTQDGYNLFSEDTDTVGGIPRKKKMPPENDAKARRAFNKAAKKAGKERRAKEKLITDTVPEISLADIKPFNDNSAAHVKKKKKLPFYRRVIVLILKIMIFGISFVIVFGYIFGLSRNQSLNMVPAFQDGDLILYLRIDKNFQANDTVLIQSEDKTVLERVVAVAGDTVDITENGLVINGGIVQEPYAVGETMKFYNGVTFPLMVPEGEIFVLGDNREYATDSRILGCIDIDDVSGSVIGAFRRRNF